MLCSNSKLEKPSRAKDNVTQNLNALNDINSNKKSLSLKELLTNSSAKDCEKFFVTKRRNFDVIVNTITKSYNEFVIKKSHKI